MTGIDIGSRIKSEMLVLRTDLSLHTREAIIMVTSKKFMVFYRFLCWVDGLETYFLLKIYFEDFSRVIAKNVDFRIFIIINSLDLDFILTF